MENSQLTCSAVLLMLAAVAPSALMCHPCFMWCNGAVLTVSMFKAFHSCGVLGWVKANGCPSVMEVCVMDMFKCCICMHDRLWQVRCYMIAHNRPQESSGEGCQQPGSKWLLKHSSTACRGTAVHASTHHTLNKVIQ